MGIQGLDAFPGRGHGRVPEDRTVFRQLGMTGAQGLDEDGPWSAGSGDWRAWTCVGAAGTGVAGGD
jgi:hypothetical protein